MFRFALRVLSAAIAASVFSVSASAQLVTNVGAIPKTGKPPVVFANGYQNDCGGATFAGTFGAADQVLQQDGRVSIFFNNCSVPNRPSIEELGNRFGEFLRTLRYDGGDMVAQVDVVAHSMGGLIIRSYLAGKQEQDGVFTPPADTRIRKALFIATPHFGTSVATTLGPAGDRQIQELQLGTTFVFDLATWNQGIDDLRGIDAISVIGDAGNGLTGTRLFNDAVTSLTSGSLGFYAANRTRIVRLCHTDGIALFACASGVGPIAQLNSVDHPTARILLSFLNDTQDWRSVGTGPEQNDFLKNQGGLITRYTDANDQPQTPTAVRAGTENLSLRSQIAYSEMLASEQPVQVTFTVASGSASFAIPLTTGATRAVTAKPGPAIAAIYPSAAAVFPRSAAPGSLISIYGSDLALSSGQPEVTISGQSMPISYASGTQINSVVPENASGLVKVQVKTTAGQRTVNLVIEPAVPAIFAPALNAVTGAPVTPQSPLRPGDYVALFLTGLGQTREQGGLNWAVIQPEVSFGGQPCVVTFAGRAPGYPGLDQINCQISMTLQATDAAQVSVRSGARTSNVTTLAVR